jgi:hypothetical protein
MSARTARLRSIAWLVVAAAVCCLSAGCVSESHDGDKTTFAMQWWGPVTLMLGSLAAGPAGFFLRAYEGRFDDISDIKLVERRSRRSSTVYLIYHTRDGKQHEFALGNEITKRAAPLILTFAQQKGIPISDGT